jgi:hypothetical protein
MTGSSWTLRSGKDRVGKHVEQGVFENGRITSIGILILSPNVRQGHRTESGRIGLEIVALEPVSLTWAVRSRSQGVYTQMGHWGTEAEGSAQSKR